VRKGRFNIDAFLDNMENLQSDILKDMEVEKERG
jgi:hypothetical protein